MAVVARTSETDIAVIGMACRVPGAATVDRFWQNLCEGVETTTFFTDEQLLAAGVDPAELHDPRYIKAAQLLADADQFDAPLFRLTAEEAQIMDPQHRQFLECVVEALENAGYRSDARHGRVGVFAGAGMNTYLLHTLHARHLAGSPLERWRLMIASDKDFLATRVSYALDLRGPSVSVNTACSTSLVAVHSACLSLLSGECDMALAGASRVAVPQSVGYLYQEGMIASPDGSCRAFDAQAAGTVFGSGVGVVVLKRLDDALAQGDCVHAVVRGSAVNNDGAAKPGYTAPSVPGQAAVILDALAAADVNPESVSYVEAHGTATPLGDPVEVAALTEAYREHTDRTGYCAIGSVKTNIGHLDTAAGMAGLIKTVLMLRHATWVPSLNFEQPNPEIDFASSPFFVNTELTTWARAATPRRAGVSSFGVGGTNAHVILEEAPPVPHRAPAAGCELLVLSARSPAALETAAGALARHLKRNRDLRLDDVAMTLATGRRPYPYRLALLAADLRSAAFALAVSDEDCLVTGGPQAAVPVVFRAGSAGSGAGALALLDALPCLRQILADCVRGAGIDPAKLLAAGRPQAMLLAQYAVARQWMAWGVAPTAVLADGVGEVVAACLTGAKTLPAALSELIGQEPDTTATDDPLKRIQLADTSESTASEVCVDLWPGPADGALAALLRQAGVLWTRGVDLDWSALHAGRGCRRVPLPATPFEHTRYWLDPAPASPGSREAGGLAVRLAHAGADKPTLVIDFMQNRIAHMLGMPAGQRPDADQNLFDMGLDSLMLIDIAARLSRELGRTVRASAFAQHPNLRAFIESQAGELGLRP